MLYTFVRFVVYLWVHFRFRINIDGLENIPSGGCILSMNHTSNYDAVIVGTHTPRKMFIMAKEELFQLRPFAWLLSHLGAFPVKRGSADVKSLKHTLKIVKEGKIFSIFIEGTRSVTDDMQEPKKGIGFIVSKSKVPVIPTYVYGAKNGWFQKAGVVFGSPLYFEDEVSYEAIADNISAAIQNLKQM